MKAKLKLKRLRTFGLQDLQNNESEFSSNARETKFERKAICYVIYAKKNFYESKSEMNRNRNHEKGTR